MFVNRLRVSAAGLLVALLATTGSTAPVPAERVKAEKELAVLAAKLHGEWIGGPCEGRLTFRANGTYEWTGIGPGGDRHAGNWAVRGNADTPTLILKCTDSDDPEFADKTTEVKLVEVGGTALVFKYPDRESPQSFERRKKEPRDP